MTDDELSRDMRKILGTEWCNEAGECLSDAMRAHCCCGPCTAVLQPSPNVAYALAEKLGVVTINSFYRRELRSWICYVSLDVDLGDRSMRAAGSARAEAECRALVALWKRIRND